MNNRRRLWIPLGAAHLVMVICGAAHWLPERSKSAIGKAVECYGRMSGADSQFGFFAPAVVAGFRTRFILQDKRDDTWTDSLEQTKSPEAGLRLEGIVEHAFANGAAEESSARRERLVKSWAAALFTRHPQAASLTIVVEAYDVPTMAEYRAGRRPKWDTVYEARVDREPAGRFEP